MSEIRPELHLWVAYLEKKEELEEAQDRIAELEAALRRIIRMLDHAAIGQHLVHMRKASSIAIAALGGGKKDG